MVRTSEIKKESPHKIQPLVGYFFAFFGLHIVYITEVSFFLTIEVAYQANLSIGLGIGSDTIMDSIFKNEVHYICFV